MEFTIVKKINGENIIKRLEYDVTLNQMVSESLPIFLSYVKERKCSYDIAASGVSAYFYDDYDIELDDYCNLQNALQFIERPLSNFLPQIGLELDVNTKFSAVDFPDKMFDKLNRVTDESTNSVPVRI